MKKLTILSLHLGYGGIENAVSSFVNNMCDEYDITLVSIYKLYSNPIYPIDSRVHIVYLINSNLALRVDRYKKILKRGEVKKFIKTVWHDYVGRGQIIKLFKDCFGSIKIVKEKKNKTINYLKNMDTDIIISTRDYFNELVSNYVDNKVEKIAWEHNHGDAEYITHVAISCREMNKIVLVSSELQKLYQEEMKKQGFNVECIYIPNIVDRNEERIASLNSHHFISVGRLAKEKGYSDLIDTFKIMYKKDKSVSLEIIGDGEEYNILKEKIKKEGLSSAIKLMGFKDREYINNALLNSSLFLMSSFTESFGIVLIEAMSVGVPCLAFDSAEGAKEIIINGVNGYLIEDRNFIDMANKALDLLKSKNKLKSMGKEAKKTTSRFDKLDIKKKWSNTL